MIKSSPVAPFSLLVPSVQQVNYLALSGLSGAKLSSVLGHSAQAMSTFSTLHELIRGVLNETAPADVAAAVVQAVYDRMKGQTEAWKVRSLVLPASIEGITS